MKFINNWMSNLELPAGVTTLALNVADGTYRLTASDADSTRWEVIGAVVASGTATLTRGLEGTLDQDWPAGSVIYSAVTAGQLGELFQRITSLEARVAALEPSFAAVVVTVGELPAGGGQFIYGLYDALDVGGAEPDSLQMPNGVASSVLIAAFITSQETLDFFFSLTGEFPQETLQSLSLEGGQVLVGAQATYSYDEETNASVWQWPYSTALPWAAGEQRRVTPTFN